MNPAEHFADTVASLLEFSELTHQLSLEERVLQTRAWLAMLYQMGTVLPASDSVPPLKGQAVSQWPSYGQFDEFWSLTNPHGHEPPDLRVLPLELAAITDDLAAGLYAYYDGHTDAALAHWEAGFRERYGQRLLAVIAALHRAVENFERPVREQSKSRNTANIVMLDDQKPSKPGVMGLRLHPLEGGALIVGVHPRGPAFGVLQIDDVILAVDGAPLQGETPKDLGLALSGPREHPRTLTIFREGETYQISLTPIDPAHLTGEVILDVLVPKAAQHAAKALEVLGCTVQLDQDRLRVAPNPQVNPSDLDVLIAAGEENQIWIREE